MTKASIIVPVHKVDIGFAKCIDSLIQLDPSPVEILIVLDGVTGKKVEGIIPESFKVLENHLIKGPSAARNLGAKIAKGEILIFCDSDVSVAQNLVAVVLSKFHENIEISALFGSYDDKPGQNNFISQFKNLMHHYTHQHSNEDANTFWGACGAIKSSVFENMRGFDENLLWLEDVDLGIRMKNKSYKIRLVKSLQVKHWKKWTASSLLISDIFHRAFPWTRLIVKHGNFQNDLNTDTVSRLSALLLYLSLTLVLFYPSTPIGLALASVAAIIVLIMNRPFYLFLIERRGWAFALLGILWHWFYYLYSALSFVTGIILASTRNIQFSNNSK